MEEQDILPELTKKLNQDLPTKKRTVEQAFEDKIVEEEDKTPITPQTKKRILSLASSLTKTDPKSYLPIINRIKDMSEQEAILYLECLEASASHETYGALTLRVLSTIADLVVHPSDIETKQEMVEDEILQGLTSRQIGAVLERAGGAALIFLIAFYGASSWARVRFINQIPFFNEAPISDDSNSKEPVGEDHSDGKTDDVSVDKTI